MLHTTSDRRLPTITNNQRGLSGGIDPDVQTFVSSAYANITDVAQVSALNYLVTALKENGFWNRFHVLYPFIGGNSTSHRFNLINPSLYAITFTGSFVHDSNGISGTGSANATATTGFADSNVDVTNLSFAYYGTWNTNGQIAFGNTNLSGGPTFLFPGTGARIAGGGGGATFFGTAISGLQFASTSTGTSAYLFRNQFLYTNFTRGTTTSGSWIIQLSRSVDANFNNMRLAFISQAYTSAEALILEEIIEKYQELLGRELYVINPDFNPITNRFLNAVGFANVDSGQQYGLNYLIQNLVDSGIYTKINALYPVVGTTAATQVRDVIGLSAASLSGSFTHTTAGMDPQTVTSFMTANPTSWAAGGYTQGFVATYINEQNTTNGFDISGTTNRMLFQATNSAQTLVGMWQGTNATVANTTTTGFWLVDIAGLSTASALYRNGSSFLAYTSGANNSTTAPYFFALPTAASGSLRRSALMAWGVTRLTASEITDFNTYVQQYQILLGRA